MHARVSSLLDQVTDKRSVDLVASFARPLPFGVISDVLGVPQGDPAWLQATMATMNTAFANQRERWPTAVEELLRFITPITRTGAGVPDDLLIGDTTFTAGAAAHPSANSTACSSAGEETTLASFNAASPAHPVDALSPTSHGSASSGHVSGGVDSA